MEPDYSKIQKGDTTVFRQFFEDFFPSLCFFANKIVRDEEAAKDIVQDAFIYFWGKKQEIRTICAAKSYLFKYVKNRSLNYLRDDHSDHSIDPGNLDIRESYTDFLIETETFRLIHKAISLLPPQCRRVTEYTLDGLKNQEIAEKMNISVNTVKTLKSRSLKSMRDKLQGISLYLFCFLSH